MPERKESHHHFNDKPNADIKKQIKIDSPPIIDDEDPILKRMKNLLSPMKDE